MSVTDPRPVLATYREFAPRAELRPYVRAFFSFVPGAGGAVREARPLRAAGFTDSDSFCSPLFASGTASIVLQFGPVCTEGGAWTSSDLAPSAELLGPVTRVDGFIDPRRRIMLGAYLHPVGTAPFALAEPRELVDRAVPLAALWSGSGAAELLNEIVDLDEASRIDRLQRELIRRARNWRPTHRAVDVCGLAAHVLRTGGRHSVASLAWLAGESRQSLTRTFRDATGIPPKLFSRLARFHAALSYVASPCPTGWARAAAELGFADQAHMIAEFRAFGGLTPQQLVAGQWFHPFIAETCARR